MRTWETAAHKSREAFISFALFTMPIVNRYLIHLLCAYYIPITIPVQEVSAVACARYFCDQLPTEPVIPDGLMTWPPSILCAVASNINYYDIVCTS